jgi:hypothetical protein
MNEAAHTMPSLEVGSAESAARDEKPLRSAVERDVGKKIERIFLRCSDPIEVKLENFTKYVRRQHLKRFLAFTRSLSWRCPSRARLSNVECFEGSG